MVHLIDKDALVAEIERRKNICKKVVWDLRTQENKDYYQGKAEAYSEMVKLIDTLEVKEVDLELNSFDATVCKICNTYLKEMDKDAIVKALESYKDGDKVKVIIKAQKGE